MRNAFVVLSIVAVTMVNAACAARYDMRQSTIPQPTKPSVVGTTDAPVEAEWWRVFDDPTLDALMHDAVAANKDLQAAAARFEAARELAGAAGLLQLPTGGPSVGVTARQASVSEVAPGIDRRVTQVQTGLGFAWEADLFGRLRGVHRAAVAEAEAAAMDARGVRVAIVAQLAAAYFELRGAERDNALITGLQERTRQQLDITNALITAGRVSRLDLFRIQQVEHELSAAASDAVRRIERARNRIATLTGRPAGSIAIPASDETPLRAQTLAIGTAEELLKRRPDIAAAESRVAAASARANIARSELFPRVEVSGAIGLVAGSVGRLTDAAAGSWLIAPRILWNVLDWPRLRREMRAAGAFADAAFAQYEQTVLSALEESQTALATYAAANSELAALELRAQAAADAAGIVLVQYREGLVDSLARTQAERDAIAGALDANRALTVQRLAVVGVYRALGGGW
jgi:NodT family efflux transporter outer membrane factor (OMF) lipoprotein